MRIHGISVGLKGLLLAGATVGVALAQPLAARAQSADQASAPAQAAPQDARAEIDELKAEVEELAGEVADLKRGQSAQIQTIPGEIDTAIAAAKPKPSWADSTHVGGQVFADISDFNQTPAPNSKNGVGLDIKRAYLSVDHTFNSVYSANVTLDFAPNGIIAGGGTYGTGTLQGSEVVKYAYLQAHYADEFVVQVGAEKTPWIPFVDDIIGYRYIDKGIVDQNKYGNSSDWGVNVHGDFGHGLFDYSLAALEGAGYKARSLPGSRFRRPGKPQLEWLRRGRGRLLRQPEHRCSGRCADPPSVAFGLLGGLHQQQIPDRG